MAERLPMAIRKPNHMITLEIPYKGQAGYTNG